MEYKWIKNPEALVTTPERELALKIADAGLEAINTEKAVLRVLKLEGEILHIGGRQFDLSKFKRLLVVGFGKASSAAAMAMEEVLSERITGGAVIDTTPGNCKHIKNLIGTHPKPSMQNFEATKEIVELANGITAEDFVVIIVSGGGSSLLCYPESEIEQSAVLYDKFLPTGANIQELNLVRKHLSFLKGGGLAKFFYPATVLGLIFSDVPGDHEEIVASGPTYKDESTLEYAQSVLRKYNIPATAFQFLETPKDDRFFEKVTNVVVVSNEIALQEMKKTAEEFGLRAKIFSSEIYNKAKDAMDKLVLELKEVEVILGGGETSLVIDKSGGSGGRNMFMALEAIKHLENNMTFIALASDGTDNSDGAGALVDISTLTKAKELGLDIETYLANYDPYRLFDKTGHEVIMTGPTEANVSDLMILLKK